ncbi:MAG: UbiX family flavin prenyltransferase [Planctomycetaceae bacterium]|nr:UbiX family flavin prenyltransferase [Planctomycetaceae bacterium]
MSVAPPYSGVVTPAADLVVAMTGASGAGYAIRLVQTLCRLGRTVHFTISPSGAHVLAQETGPSLSLKRFDPAPLGDLAPGRLVYHHHADFTAGIASGSFLTSGMVVIPCSMSTLGAIAGGVTSNLITRAADVHLKERRKLILVPRETPLSLIHLENMAQVTRAGAIVLPAAPGWYHQPRRLEDLLDFIVARICDQLGIPNHLINRWGSQEKRIETDDSAAAAHTSEPWTTQEADA